MLTVLVHLCFKNGKAQSALVICCCYKCSQQLPGSVDHSLPMLVSFVLTVEHLLVVCYDRGRSHFFLSCHEQGAVPSRLTDWY